MQQLSGLDASFLYTETSSSPMHVASVQFYDPSTAPNGRVTFADIQRNIASRLHLARCFRQKLVQVPMDLDHPYWIEDPDFDLEFHLRQIALPAPGDWRQLCTQVARLHSRPLDLTRPLWELYMIERLDDIPGLPEGSFAIVTKIHHAAVDGVSGMELTAAIHDTSPDAVPAAPDHDWKPESQPTPLELLMRTYGNNLRQPFRLARVLSQSVPAMARVTAGLRQRRLRAPVGEVPRTRFNDSVTSHRVVDARTFPLDEIRAIKAKVPGATVNDAVLAIVGGALRKYLQSKGELPEQSLVAMAPISVRTKEEAGTAGNQVSAMAVSLRSDIEDPLERLREVHEGTQNSKELTHAVGARLLTDMTQFIPGGLAALAARTSSQFGLANRVNPFANCVVTNVPGPQEPLYMSGARMVGQIGMGPVADGLGLIHPVLSYCGELVISPTSCREMMPDIDFYADCIQDAFEALRTAALGPRSTDDAAPFGDPVRAEGA